MDRLDDALYEIISHIHNLQDRKSFSLVCHKWHTVKSETRQHVSIPFSYSTCPDQLHRRYGNLESLKIKGQHRATKFGLIRGDWGGYAGPWVDRLYSFVKLHSLHLCRMSVRDIDLNVIGGIKKDKLRSLKLEYCWGFSTNGLKHITKCRNLTTLSLEGSQIIDEDGKWLQELSLHNGVLETLHLAELQNIAFEDLVRIATTCPLASLKIANCTLRNLKNIWTNATNLEEFAGVLSDEPLDLNMMAEIKLPPYIRSFHLGKLKPNQLSLVYPVSHLLTKLDLRNSMLTEQDHWTLLSDCPSLEVLQVYLVIGDTGLEKLAPRCGKLKSIFIDRDELDNTGVITDTGLLALSQGCPKLESIVAYVTSISNVTLQYFGARLKHLYNFRVKVLGTSELILDDGVRAILRGCSELKVLHLGAMIVNAHCFRHIGDFTTRLEWLSLFNVLLANEDLNKIVRSFPYLKKLDIFGYNLTGEPLTHAMLNLTDLRMMWVKMCFNRPIRFHHPEWKIEVAKLGSEDIDFILAYRSLLVRRNDFPQYVEHYLPHEL